LVICCPARSGQNPQKILVPYVAKLFGEFAQALKSGDV